VIYRGRSSEPRGISSAVPSNKEWLATQAATELREFTGNLPLFFRWGRPGSHSEAVIASTLRDIRTCPRGLFSDRVDTRWAYHACLPTDARRANCDQHARANTQVGSYERSPKCLTALVFA
jgi:hypothetical protein